MPKKIALHLKHNKVMLGVVMMMLHALAMAANYLIAKGVNQSLPAPQVAFLYKLVILITAIPWCFSGDYKKDLGTKRLGLHVARATFSLLGTLCYFMAIQNLPISTVSAVSYLDHTIVVLIGFWYFKEKLSGPKLTMIIFSFIGAFLIIKPGYSTFNYHYIYMLLAVAFWASNILVIKILGSSERSKAQLFYVMLFSSIFSLPMALYGWKPMEAWQINYILALALCYFIHTVTFFKALKYADISTVMPYDYTRLIFTGILGYFFLGESPDYLSLIGFGLIIFGGIFAVTHEAARKKSRLSEAKKIELEAEYDKV